MSRFRSTHQTVFWELWITAITNRSQCVQWVKPKEIYFLLRVLAIFPRLAQQPSFMQLSKDLVGGGFAIFNMQLPSSTETGWSSLFQLAMKGRKAVRDIYGYLQGLCIEAAHISIGVYSSVQSFVIWLHLTGRNLRSQRNHQR